MSIKRKSLKTIGLLTFIIILVSLKSNLFAQDPFPGTALNFDGTDNYVQCGDSGSIGISNSLTIEAWIKVPSSFPAGSRVGNIIGNFAHSPNFNLEGHTNGRLRFWWNGGELNIFTTNFDMRDDSWHHIAVIRDFTENEVIFYVDGEIRRFYPNAGSNVDYQWPLRIGGDFRANPGIPFNGLIEEVRLWNVVRTEQEIRENMHLTLTGNETGLVSYWQFNEASGDTTYDPVGDNNGTLFNFDVADWITSTTPVGGGNSSTQIVSSTGVFDFTGTNLSMDFIAKNGTDTIVVSHLNLGPNTTPSNYATFNSQYWVVNKFGGSAFTGNLTFTPNEVITPEDEFSPSALRLFSRISNSIGSWSNLMGGASANASSNTVTFNNISSFSQFLIGRQWFTDINAGLTSVRFSSAAWGDYDNDSDLDILLTGDTGSSYISRIYRNDSGIFTHISAGMTGIVFSSASWGDYDNDGDLDILLTGSGISRIYRNDSGIFTDISAGLTGVYASSVAWGDYDNDGDLDILLTGKTNSDSNISKIYNNNSGDFTDINAGLTGVQLSSVAWGDYDNDGDLDILLTGHVGTSNYISKIYRNDDGVFTAIGAGLRSVAWSSVAWGDYDNDGDLDILLTGFSSSSGISRIYRNDTGLFTDINAGLTGIRNSSVAWGDYDNDGDLDILLTGYIGINRISRIYRNDSGVFSDINAGLPGVFYSSAAWGDYDNDGDLDILLTGDTGSSGISRIYRNNNTVSNSAPFSPTSLTAVISSGSLTFSWNKANDNETPQDGLSYNLFLGNSGLDILLKPPQANVDSGYRLIPAFGNVCQVTSWSYQIPELYLYPQVEPSDYWGVQAIDHAFAGSEFAIDSLDIPISNLQTINNSIMQLTDFLHWDIQFGDSIVSYQVQIDDDSTFNNHEVDDTIFVSLSGSGIYSIALQDLSGSNSFVEGIKYYWRVKPNYTFNLPTAFTKPAPSFWFGYENAVEGEGETAIPKEFALFQNYPNPFNPSTQIRYALPEAAMVKLALFDVLGRKIKTLLDEEKQAGYHTFRLDGGNLASGVYIYRLQAGDFISTKKMLLMK
ncbi:MAG: hypothetical protein DRQ13_04695 [Ignavibacteriae bacterium]|nr:MAG: hypothetical protein DRQ13_04695 [Ignavibacteriota bacterium]